MSEPTEPESPEPTPTPDTPEAPAYYEANKPDASLPTWAFRVYRPGATLNYRGAVLDVDVVVHQSGQVYDWANVAEYAARLWCEENGVRADLAF